MARTTRRFDSTFIRKLRRISKAKKITASVYKHRKIYGAYKQMLFFICFLKSFEIFLDI